MTIRKICLTEVVFKKQIPGEGNGNPLQDYCLENPMDGEAWWVLVHGVAESNMTEQLRVPEDFGQKFATLYRRQ